MMRSRTKEHPRLYPKWSRKDSPARQAKERDGWKCVDCRKPDREIYTNAAGEVCIRFLHAAHIHPLDPDPVEPIAGQRLRARCPRCHRVYDLYWQNRSEEVEHQRRLHAIKIDQYFMLSRFSRRDCAL